jgi:hypothetical protein
MKPIIGYLLSWVLYLLGDTFSRVEFMQWSYQWLMCNSWRLQEWGGKGPWREA